MPVFTEVARDVAFMRCAMVNVVAIGSASRWVLVDCALRGFAAGIRAAADDRFGPGARPAAIVLTHGHFDHVGSLEALLGDWDVPVFAHRLEMPYVRGRSPYPPPDPLVGGGIISLISRMYPRGPIDLGSCVQHLPSDGSVPDAPEWQWIHTPGHSPGHVSLYREADRTLVSGDALTTTKQESLCAVMVQRRELKGPPAYYTQDWDRAGDSVRVLAALRPEVIIAGHGEPASGEAMRARLDELALHFDQVQRPRIGRYANQPAVADESGLVMLPHDPLPAYLAGAAAMALAAGLVWAAASSQRRRQLPM